MAETSYTDAAKRCSDIITLHVLAGNHGKWVMIKLGDGSSDGTVYDSRSDAVYHNDNKPWGAHCVYILMPRDGMSPRNAETFLEVNRKLHAAGMRLTDPDHEPHVPQTTFDALKPHLWLPGRRFP